MRRFAWPIALPSIVGGVFAAHWLAYRLTVPPDRRATVLEHSGHAWFRYLPLVGALAPRGPRPCAWPFALLPPLMLFLQEQLERGHFALDPAIVAGVLLAVPIGLAAYALARLAARVSDAIGVALVTQRLSAAKTSFPFAPNSVAIPEFAFAASLGARGPPARGR